METQATNPPRLPRERVEAALYNAKGEVISTGTVEKLLDSDSKPDCEVTYRRADGQKITATETVYANYLKFGGKIYWLTGGKVEYQTKDDSLGFFHLEALNPEIIRAVLKDA